MSTSNSGKGRDAGRAQHGPRSEVNWEGGSGRQPYSNQGAVESRPPHGEVEAENGSRGVRSGRNLDQLEEARRKP